MNDRSNPGAAALSRWFAELKARGLTPLTSSTTR